MKTMKNKIIQSYFESCHDAALRYIEAVTDFAQIQAESEGVQLDPYKITAEDIVRYAAKHIGADYNELYQNYVDFMVLEKMIELVPSH